ncbi:MAG TPA: radical SAM family heme chaperone HemW [Bryobacteraceae bacterium]|nr:radical SAM family heme chaperone HemW [Bryobacteraceae bacterium]
MPGVYISYPFCAQKCTYCNFASGVFPRELEPKYLAALRAEIERCGFGNGHWPWTPETVYLGGGTPSQMDPDALAALLKMIPGGSPGSSPGSKWMEATMEAAPGTITKEKAAAWRRAGINRVSLGVQSFVQKEIARTGRKHTAEIVEREVAMLRETGTERINIDLIAGLPSQTAASWNESLEWIERLGPPHVSVYMLEVDEDSRLGRELIAGGPRYGAMDVPSEDLIASFYEIATERLKNAGIERYEISNFARLGHESRHNLKYWRREPYLGFGADAHSFDGVARWQNPETAAEYVAGFPAPVRTPADERGEKWFLGLRLREGIEIGAGSDENREFQEVVERILSDGLAERVEGRLRLTDRGILLSNEIFAEFV